MTATQAPTPGPLDSESVKLLVKGDLVAGGDLIGALKGSVDGWGCATIVAPNGAEFSRILHKGFAFVGRPGADGWIVHDGSGNNPAVAMRIDVWFRGEPDPAITRNEPANGWADFQWKRIAKWRPTAFRLAPAAPVEASGSEREDVEDIEWPESPLGNDLYRHVQAQYCLHDDEAAEEAGEILSILAKHGVDPLKLPSALRPQPSGETRKAGADAQRELDRAEAQDHRTVSVRIGTMRTLLSALGGQQGEGEATLRPETSALLADFKSVKNRTTPARAEAQDEGAAGEPVTLAECPPGLFLWNGTLGFKSEYGAMEPVDLGKTWTIGNGPDAYCADSGEYFWGGTSNHADRAKVLVMPIDAVSAAHPSPTPAASVCDACGDKGYVESEGGEGEGWPSRPEIEACPRCAPNPVADADEMAKAVERLKADADYFDDPEEGAETHRRALCWVARDIRTVLGLAALKSTAAKEGGE